VPHQMTHIFVLATILGLNWWQNLKFLTLIEHVITTKCEGNISFYLIGKMWKCLCPLLLFKLVSIWHPNDNKVEMLSCILWTIQVNLIRACHQKEKANIFYMSKPLVLNKHIYFVLLKYCWNNDTCFKYYFFIKFLTYI